MKIAKIKADTPEAQNHAIPELEKTLKGDIKLERTSTLKYHTRSSTKRVNHMRTFKKIPKMFQVDARGKIKTHIGTA